MCVGYFNSRLYTRGDVTANLVKKEIPLFQFTPLHERRRNPFASHQAAHPFQFTPLHERRRNQSVWISNDDYFNSRLYTRGDDIDYNIVLKVPISIHASTREATLMSIISNIWLSFQFTPLHERRRRMELRSLPRCYFNSRLYTRGDSTECPVSDLSI